MSNHKKPTEQELDQGINKTLEDIENLDDEDKQDEEEENHDEEENKDNDKKDGEDKGEEDSDDDGDDEEKSDDKKEDAKDDESNKDNDKKDEDPKDKELKTVKKNYADQTREAQILAAQRKKTNQAIDQAAEITDVSEDELKAEYPDWEDLNETQQKIAKKAMIADKRFALINSVREAEKDVESWNTKVDEFIGDPKTLVANSELEGKEDEFKIFAGKESRRGADFSLLVSAFLRDYEKSKPKHRGEMFPTGGGGDKKSTKREDGKISFEEGQKLRKNNSRQYATLLQQNKIADPTF